MRFDPDDHAPWHYTEYGVICTCGEPMGTDEICMAQLREASTLAHFERLREAWDAFVASLPLPVRIWTRHIGPYGIRFSAFLRRSRQ